MAYTSVSISTAQALGTPSVIVLTDDHVGTDATIVTRRVYLRATPTRWLYETQQSSATETYTNWPIADGATISLDVLTEASTLEITVDWLNGANVAVYTYTIPAAIFPNQDYIFQLGVLADQTSAPGVLQDLNYYNNLMQFIVNLDNAEVAAVTGGDLYSSQQALNRNQVMMDNEANYF